MKTKAITAHQVRQFKDLALFGSHDFQRRISPAHIKRLVLSMKQHGFMWDKPLIVIPASGGKYTVVDGHNRLEAARQLKIPVWVAVRSDVTTEQSLAIMRDVCGTVKAWPLFDIIRSHTLDGNEDYKTLMHYVEQGLPITAVSSLLAGNQGGTGNHHDQIRSGTFKVKTTEYADAVLSLLAKFGLHRPIITNSRFIVAFSKCLFVPEFKLKTFVTRLASYPALLVAQPTVGGFLKNIDEIYNYGARGRIPLEFLANEAARNRMPIKDFV